jgi:CBS domain containing-hemolysin-like protein
LNPPPTAALVVAAQRPENALDPVLLWLVAGVVLALTGLFATLRQALLMAIPSHVIDAAGSDERKAELRGLLERADSLAGSAGALKIGCDLVFLLLALGLVQTGDDREASLGSIGIALGISVPLILFVGEILPGLVAGTAGDVLLARWLPTFNVLQLPIAALIWLLESVQRVVGRVFGLRESSPAERRILAGLRKVIADSPIEGDLDETEREIIENVMEFRDVDAMEIMTPRTEIEAIELGSDIKSAAERVAESGHSRIPVFSGSLDSIVGFFTARDLLKADAIDSAEGLSSVIRPAYFIPETKRVSELLAEFRKEKLKLAIVLDEYGGTAGIVTMGDILEELVGDIPDEFDSDEPAPIRAVAPDLFEVDATLRVSEANEELGIELPEEEDFETLAGFVLSELGHFPKPGESFTWGDSEFSISEANDRRVLKLTIRVLAAETSA